MATLASPPAVALRNTMAWLTGKLARGAALRSLTPVYDWQPPAPAPPAGTTGNRLSATDSGLRVRRCLRRSTTRDHERSIISIYSCLMYFRMASMTGPGAC
jgi:hypothetical protein